MTAAPRPERSTQNRVVKLLTTAASKGGLGFSYLGDWTDRFKNRSIDEKLLTSNLKRRGYDEKEISAALRVLGAAAEVINVSLYEANRRTWQLLRYGIAVQPYPGVPNKTVHLIDWDHPDRNDFAVAEEVTLKHGHERRPDLVIYLNGIAVVVIELKRGSVEVGNGIRQLISNQLPIFNEAFFSTVQLLLAGNDSQGLRFGTVTTEEKFFVEWKAGRLDGGSKSLAATSASDELPVGAFLDRPLTEMLDKARLLDLIRNCMVFDGGRKKVPRLHQYIGLKRAQERLASREGGVIWHTQGSGKSILMVLLIRWILEHDSDARILIVTDRDELDKQIDGVMRSAGILTEDSPSSRVVSRSQLFERLSGTLPRVNCALIHKFEINGTAPNVHGRFYVFVDECHRTQGGEFNRTMKTWLPNAIFVGFTGTPLLKTDRQTTRETFGTYIHTYKFPEAVADGVVLDLKYEAREVPQRLTSPEQVDAWFEKTTRTLNTYQKAVIRQKWATMENLLSAQDRKQRIIHSILEDFTLCPRLSDDQGTALLVAASIRDACEYFRLFLNTSLGKHCGIVTSYEPSEGSISNEAANSDAVYKFETYKQHVLRAGQTTDAYEQLVKRQFIHEPANMKLLIVVSKLLTGFDAPSCTCIYLDNEMHDHTLFQAICRTNRLDGDCKDFGYIVDFKQLLGDVQNAIAIYSADSLDLDAGDGGTNNIEIKNWLVEGRKQLEATREALRHLCDPVPPPKQKEQYLTYFCGDAADPEGLTKTEPLRISFYKMTAAFVRAFSNIAVHLVDAGYTPDEADKLKNEAKAWGELRDEIKAHSGEELDIKPYEADMRQLLNMYVVAEPAKSNGHLESLTLTELIVESGMAEAIAMRLNASGKLPTNAIAEGIINNLRKTIIREQLTDPKYYEQMSSLLKDLIDLSRAGAAKYEEFLKRAAELAKQALRKSTITGVPDVLRGKPEATVLFRNLPAILAKCNVNIVSDLHLEEQDAVAQQALRIDQAMIDGAPANWRGDSVKEAEVQNLLFPLLAYNREATLAVFELLRNQAGYR